MRSRHLMTLRLATATTQDIGATPRGTLSIFPVTGGSFDGDRLRGRVLAGGGDWVITKGDSLIEVDLRVTLETDDGALIVGSSRVDLQACKLEYSIVSPK